MADFVIARNPAEGTRLPYLIRLPLRDGELILAARDVWPRAVDLYCHPVPAWPEAVEEVSGARRAQPRAQRGVQVGRVYEP